MDFKDAGQHTAVKSSLVAIEDKLRERGFLKKATGDSEADVFLEYGTFSEGDEEGPYLLIKISSGAPPKKIKEALFEQISDFVNEKLDDLKGDWDQDVTEAIDEAWGQVVLLNGEKVY